jgi:ParB-like chromosome segregation protein Spo0J
MNLQRVALDDLSTFDDNPRTIDPEGLDRLSASLRRFGLYVPLVVWPDPARGLVVVGGNQRLTALRRMRDAGEPVPSEIPVVVLDCSEVEARTIVLRDNTHDGEWEWSSLSAYLSDLVETDSELDLASTGFDREVLDELVALGSDPLLAATDPVSASGEAIEDGSGDEPRTKAEIEQPRPATSTRFVIGNVRGKIPIALYGRMVGVFDERSKVLGTNDLGVVLGSLLDDLRSTL